VIRASWCWHGLCLNRAYYWEAPLFHLDASYAVDVLTQEVLGFTATRGARLLSVTVSVPEALATIELAERLRRALDRFGLGLVEIEVVSAESAPYIKRLEYER
jgi:hypothetical protein